MISDLPGDLGGSHPLGGWLNRLKRALKKRTLLSGLGYKVRYTETGTLLEILPGNGAPPAGGGPEMFRLKSVQGDYLTCRTWDGDSEGGTDVLIAKVQELRNSITQDVFGSSTVTYLYTSTTERVARFGLYYAIQTVAPPYVVNRLVWGSKAATGVVGAAGEPVGYLEENQGRSWTRIFDF